MPPGGFRGRFLDVDLTTGRATARPLPDDVLRRFVGGVGLGTWLLARTSPAGVDPLAPEAAFVVALSPLVGTPLTTSAKFAVVAKSPLTDRISDALASDRFAIELKRCGTDALVLRGACAEWSLVVVDDGGVHIEPAGDLVGLTAADAESKLRARRGEAWRFFGIGPAGERLVRYATCSGDGRHAGRGGLGAVLGAKRVKGIVVRGTGVVPVADPERVVEFAKDLSARSFGPATAKYREVGTVANLLVLNRLGALPTRNFREGSFEGADAVSAEALRALPSIRRSCAACTIGCEHVFPAPSGAQVRVEYEGLFALGPNCGIADRDAVLELSARCDALGLDVISAGGTIAFAMECRDRGLLGDEAPRFGDAAAALRLLDDIAARRGLGAVLAEGSRRAAETIGRGAERLAMHVKGLELPGYEPRRLQAMALGLAVATRGADHNRSGAYEIDFRPGGAGDDDAALAAAVVDVEVRAAVLDSLILCKFLRGVFDDVVAEGAAMLAAVTGWEMTADELRRVGERVVVARKLWNVRAGWNRAEDTLPARLLDEPQARAAGDRDAPAPLNALSRATLERRIATYYAAQGWTASGAVPPARVRALGLDDLFPPETRVNPTPPRAADAALAEDAR